MKTMRRVLVVLAVFARAGAGEDAGDSLGGALSGFARSTMRCRRSSPGVGVPSCLGEVFLEALDRSLSVREIHLNDYVSLVKDNASVTDTRNVLIGNGIAANSFTDAVCYRLLDLLETRSFRINFVAPSSVQGRRRRYHYKKAFPMMVAGFMMMSSFLVPLGFQFMAMIGGKALLLSKLAFLMALYGGAKRIYSEVDLRPHLSGGHDAPLGWHRSASDSPPSALVRYRTALPPAKRL